MNTDCCVETNETLFVHYYYLLGTHYIHKPISHIYLHQCILTASSYVCVSGSCAVSQRIDNASLLASVTLSRFLRRRHRKIGFGEILLFVISPAPCLATCKMHAVMLLMHGIAELYDISDLCLEVYCIRRRYP